MIGESNMTDQEGKIIKGVFVDHRFIGPVYHDVIFVILMRLNHHSSNHCYHHREVTLN